MAESDYSLATDHLRDNVERRSRNGSAITFAGQGIKVAAQLCSMIVLARLLPPQAFGLVAMIGALTQVLDLVKELGLSAATIQKRDITQAQVSALFWINAGAGAFVSLCLIVAAPAIAAFYGEPRLLAITCWIALAFLFSGLTTQHWAMLRRQMRFGTVTVVDAGSELFGFAVAIVAAALGSDYWALVMQRLGSAAVALLASWYLCRWRPDRPSPAGGVGELLRYGASLTGFNLITALARGSDQVLIGWLWGAVTLGLYDRAYRLLMMPINNINAPVYAIAMPALCRIADDPERYRRAFVAIMLRVGMLTIPSAIFASVTADWIVRLLFGFNWVGAGPLLGWFALAASYQPFTLAAGLLFLTQNRPREMLQAGLVAAVLSILAIGAGLAYGAVGVAASLAISGLLVRTPIAFWLAARRGHVKIRDLYLSALPSCSAACAAGCAAYGIRQVAMVNNLTPAVGLVVAGLVSTIAAMIVFSAYGPTRRALFDTLHLPILLIVYRRAGAS